MARMTIDGMDGEVRKLESLETGLRRTGIRRIVEAGAAAASEEMSQNIQKYHHVGKTRSMLQNVGGADYRESFDGGEMSVYPQGTDPKGVRNALKAYVINYGRGRNPTRRGTQNRTGDHFITGNFRKAEEKVKAAMAAEASAFLKEAIGTGG